MTKQKKLARWADQLLDTGKRNNLISFKDSKASSAEIVFPDIESVFANCSAEHSFEVFDPKIKEESKGTDSNVAEPDSPSTHKLNKNEFKDLYAEKIKGASSLLIYAQTANPMTAIRNIAKKAKVMQDETGINVAYLAFGFVHWKDREASSTYYKAPLLLVHVNIVIGSMIDPIHIEVSDDDVVVNPTFDYLLQAEYGIKLPDFNDEDTLTTYLDKVDRSVKNLGWKIIPECKLGTFSFLKINMYEDLKNNEEKILKNKNIRALLGERVSSESHSSREESAAVENPLIDLHTVVAADSSQIEAIERAKSGESFVLQGPPGTGKSQTITNIIAECLHDGKRVLFVSEKQAALNVVFDKLKQAGLEDFCLELHSHKANKKVVIDELNRTMNCPRSRVSGFAQIEIERKEKAQKKLDDYAHALHMKRVPIGESLYRLYELFTSQKSFPDMKYTIPSIASRDENDLHHSVDLLDQYAEYVPTIGNNYRENPWYGFRNQALTYEQRNQLREDLAKILTGYQELQSTTSRLKQKYETPGLNLEDSLRWQSVLSFSAESDVITPALMAPDRLQRILPFLKELQELSETILEAESQISENYDLEIISEIDGKEYYTLLSEKYHSTFSHWFNREYKDIISRISKCEKKGIKVKYQQALDITEKLIKIQALLQEYKDKENTLGSCLGKCYEGPDTDWTHVMQEIEVLTGYFHRGIVSFGSLSEMNQSVFAQKQDELRKDADLLKEQIEATVDVRNRLRDQFETSVLDMETMPFDQCIKKLQSCLDHFDGVNHWIQFLALKKMIDDAGLATFVDAVIENGISADEVSGAYKKIFYKQWIENIMYSDPVVANFTRISQDAAVESFKKQDDTQYEISKVQIKSELSQKRPNIEYAAAGSAVSVLRREGTKKRKQMPIRKLLSTAGELVQQLKPCFLMSPLSVSTFLDPEALVFDTVVFDEASQIFPQDAIGAIYRGKQLIVVGDSKQMPPSNFFNASTDIDSEDEEIDDITDFESVLDLCSAVFSTQSLAWHYRSHYEQLIAFSNLNFYDGHLVTFPSSVRDRVGIGVDFFPVEGTFDRKTKTNMEEAKYIVDLVYKNFKEFPTRSLGVVAFSVAQQNLIDNLIQKKREEDPAYEEFFKADRPEPFFVKNLETVQGDERDTIIFSVAYARDQNGKFYQNFGPLNRAGGERRLNVAVTRAKENVQLVSSIRYTDINISNTGSRGVKLLRAYLDYAQNGEIALERDEALQQDESFDSALELDVCEFLRSQGYTVDTKVGCSGYKIDIALRKPDSANYLLAIECDGAAYHRARNARDRDSLRQSILEKMGWEFYRIWSTEWYRNQTVEKQRLLEAVHKAITDNEKITRTNVHTGSLGGNTTSDISNQFVKETSMEDEKVFPSFKELDALTIYNNNNKNLPQTAAMLVKTEGPVSEEYLMKRMISIFDREKVTKRVIEEFGNRMNGCARYGIVRKNGFIYLKNTGDIHMKIPGDKREIKYICTEELADGLMTLIRQNVSASKEAMYKMLTGILGFSRTGEAFVKRYEEALCLLKKKKKIVEHEGIISIA